MGVAVNIIVFDLCCGRFYNKRTLRGFFVDSKDLSTRSNMYPSQAARNEKLLKSLHTKCNLYLVCYAASEGRQKRKNRRNVWYKKNKATTDRRLPCCVMSVQENGTSCSTSTHVLLILPPWKPMVNAVASASSKEQYEFDATTITKALICRLPTATTADL